MKRLTYGFVIVATSGYGIAAVPAVELASLILIVLLSNERVFALVFELLVLATYILAVVLPDYGTPLQVVATVALALAILHQMYYIWGEKFFDIFDEREVKNIIKNIANMEIRRAEESRENIQDPQMQGFEKV